MKAPLLTTLSLLLGGCALTDFTITTPYTPSPGAAWARTPLDVTVELRPTIAGEADTVGVKKNGYGMDTARVFTDPPASGWIERALLAELTAQGFTIGQTEANPWVEQAPRPERARLEVIVTQLFVEPDVGFWAGELTAVLIADVRVVLPDGRRFTRRFVAEESETMMAWLDRDFERMLHQAVETALPHLVQSVRQLIDREAAHAT